MSEGSTDGGPSRSFEAWSKSVMTELGGTAQAKFTLSMASCVVITYRGRWTFGLGFQSGWPVRHLAQASAVALLTRLRTGVVT